MVLVDTASANLRMRSSMSVRRVACLLAQPASKSDSRTVVLHVRESRTLSKRSKLNSHLDGPYPQAFALQLSKIDTE